MFYHIRFRFVNFLVRKRFHQQFHLLNIEKIVKGIEYIARIYFLLPNGTVYPIEPFLRQGRLVRLFLIFIYL